MIDDLELQKLIKWTPHPNQQKILDCQSHDIDICAGRRFGKSAISGYMVLRTLMEPGTHTWIVAPTYDLTQKVLNYVIEWYLRLKPRAPIKTRPYPKIKTPWGSWVEGHSASEPQSLLGEEVDLLIMDEAPLIPRKVWEDKLFPVTASRKARIIKIGSPFGQNWFYEDCLRLKETGGFFNFKSSDGVSITEEQMEEYKLKLPELLYKQNFLAEFLPDGASVFRGVREIMGDTLKDSMPGHFYSLGVDIAKLEDFSVITIIDRGTKEVVYWDRFKDIEYPFQKSRIEAAARRYNNARVTIDSTGVGQPIRDDLSRNGVFVDDFTFSNKSKKELIEKLSIFIEQKLIRIPDNEILVDELQAFGMKLTDSGNVIYSAPEGYHDDCVYSLALAVWGLTQNPKDSRTELERQLEEGHRQQKKKGDYI